MSEPALFVGGPWDGRHVMMEHPYGHYEVRVAQFAHPSGTINFEGPDVIQHEVRHVIYRRVAMLDRVFYLAEPDWWQAKGPQQDPHSRLVRELVIGYRVPL